MTLRADFNIGDKDIIALLPGSRKQEISKMLTVMLSLVDDFKQYQFVVAGAPSQTDAFYHQFIGNNNVTFMDMHNFGYLI